jgi:hypothetical protein
MYIQRETEVFRAVSYNDYCLLGYDPMSCGRTLPVFQSHHQGGRIIAVMTIYHTAWHYIPGDILFIYIVL